MKLTDQQREDIRFRSAAGERQIDLAHEFGVVPSTIRYIVHGSHSKPRAYEYGMPVDERRRVKLGPAVGESFARQITVERLMARR